MRTVLLLLPVVPSPQGGQQSDRVGGPPSMRGLFHGLASTSKQLNGKQLITLVFATTEAVWEVSSTAGNPSPRARSAWGASARSTWGSSSAGIPTPSAAGVPSPSANSTWEVPAAGTPSPRGRNDKVVVKVDAVEVSGWEVSMEGIPSPEVKNT